MKKNENYRFPAILNGFRHIFLMHFLPDGTARLQIEVDQRTQSDGGNNGADTDRTAEKKPMTVTSTSTTARHAPADRPNLRASATISASRGPLPSALFMYSQVPSAKAAPDRR